MKIIMMAFGSRGDIQPFVALAVALRERGHEVTLAAPTDMEALINAYQVPYIRIPISVRPNDPEIARQVESKGMTPGVMLRLIRNFIPELRRSLLDTAQIVTEAARDADLLISHGFMIPFAWSIHEHLKIPLITAIAMPVIPTQAFPAAFFPPLPFGQRFYNPRTYGLLMRLITSFMIQPMNAYRRGTGLATLSWGKAAGMLANGQIPVLMHYSRHVVPVPADWSANVHVTGAWSLPVQPDWTPPEALSTFLAQGEPPVYIGFGSMPVAKPAKTAQNISQALRLANLRGVLQAGWGGLTHEDEHVITIGDAPHDWLFPRMAAFVHHGGSGTTHSGLRAGKPALIVPFSADQPFWARRLVELGVGLPPIAPKKLTPERLAGALRILTGDSALRERATSTGALLRAEDGLKTACDLIEQHVST